MKSSKGDPNAPRKLTNEEIEDIVSVIPKIKSAADTVTEYNSKSMRSRFTENLKMFEMTPLAIPDLKEEILRQYRESLIAPGSMVGVLASDSFSKPITQNSLNSFQTSGSAKNVTGGIQRIEELTNATRNPKKTSATIYFKDSNLTYRDVLTEKRPIITEITVKDLILGMPDVENTLNFEAPTWYEFYELFIGEIPGEIEEEEKDDSEEEKDTEEKDDSEKPKRNKDREVLRLKLDINVMFAHKLTMEDVVKVLSTDGSVTCVYSPLSIGEIDVYPEENLITAELAKRGIQFYDNAPLTFLTMVVIPTLDKLRVSGISGIQQIYPNDQKVLQIVKSELLQDGIWFLMLNTYKVRSTGITPEKLARLCRAAGLEVLKVRDTYVSVTCPTSPLEYLRDAITKDEKETKEYQKRLRNESLKKARLAKEKSEIEVGENVEFEREVELPVLPRQGESEISAASKLVYAECTGSNLKELLRNPEIDATRTISNDVHDIYAAFGIEAANNFLIQEFISYFGDSGYINPRHISLLSSFMTSLGQVHGITFGGISRQSIGAFEKASIEKAMDTFKEAGGFGEINSAEGTSSSIFIGKKAAIGTGYSDSFIPEKNLERYHKLRKEFLEDVDMTLNIDSFNDAVQEFEVETEGVALLEGAEEEMFGLGIEHELGADNTKSVRQVKKTPIVEAGKNTAVLMRGPVVKSKELVEAGKELGEKIAVSVSCTDKVEEEVEKLVVKFPKSNVSKIPLPSLKPVKNATVIKPVKAPIEEFSLDDFLN